MNSTVKKEYDSYLQQHINNVRKGYDWLCNNLPELIAPEIENIIEENIDAHDSSKYSDEEYLPYAEYFYGEKTKEVESKFNYAWLHHIHVNSHHWQYWLLQHDDEGLELLEIPYEYIIEMIRDHWAFSWSADNLYEIFDWYAKHKATIKWHDKSKQTYEDILNKIKAKLDQLQ